MIEGVTGAVLAGGESRRFGSPKALAPWGGAPLVSRAVGLLSPLFSETLLVVKDPRAFHFAGGARVVEDLVDGHALGGIYTALRAAKTPRVFVLACDMPFVTSELVAQLCAVEAHTAAPLCAGAPQPLCAVYSKSLLPAIGEMLAAKNFRARELLSRRGARLIAHDDARPFRDLDTRPEYEAALQEHEHVR